VDARGVSHAKSPFPWGAGLAAAGGGLTVPSAPALWIDGPGEARLRDTAYLAGAADVEVETLFSGISRGTERLVYEGRVPEAEFDRMRAPFQEGGFDFPVKYGYSAVGRVTAGPKALLGRIVFVLHPHQARFACAAEAAIPVPEAVPPGRAILGANMETALNVVWDSGAGPGDRVTVVGAGVVGALTAWLAARLPGAEVTLVDIDRDKAALAEALGCAFLPPAEVTPAADVVIHASGSGAGLVTALAAAAREATVVEASWHGTAPVTLPLGGAFHSQRLRIVSSQVGAVPANRAPRWSFARRLATALSLLADPALDALISGETALADLPRRYGDILADPGTLCHRVSY
jgi:NADPH:quinone reductase-like Zn-dependent oxidoreductase